jgi:hypothetical protein
MGEQAWGVRGLKTWRRALDHRRLRERTGIASASALFGQSPSIVSSRAQISGDSMVLALPALTHQFVFPALQAQPVPKGLLAEQLSCSNDAAQLNLGLKNSKPQWRRKVNQALSPLSSAVHCSNSLMPETWEPIQANCGASRRDRKATSALLVFSHQTLLLEKMIEVFPSVISDRD